jgi:hypothetical protein
VFLVHFGIARVKDASAADNMEILSGFTQWNMSFVRKAHDLEVDIFASFFQVLHSAIVSRGCAYRLWWVSSKRGLFKVKSFFSSLACFESNRFLWKSVWRTHAPLMTIFLLGQRPLVRSLQWIISGRCMLS